MAEPEAERRTENDCIVYEMNFVLQSQFLNSFSGQSLSCACGKPRLDPFIPGRFRDYVISRVDTGESLFDVIGFL